ncbi:hypothetical protein BKA65DRAFT_485044 [Rhexocercosporidium sp. MPI-PUGE-AT-0058]|nr:hypothetical protein BKA65DRAFT_485044 [Rhexocercosporidium sp. MPI-PUGE-AT-0058]
MLNNFALVLAFLVALSEANPIESTADNELVARTSVNFIMSNYNAYPCDNAGASELGVSITPGQCHNINFAGWGSKVVNSNINQNCVLKFWDTANCQGQATTWTMWGGNTDELCFPSARQSGVNKFGAGARSVIANCAFDVIPGRASAVDRVLEGQTEISGASI